jgi:hypothetical protein
MEMAYNVDNWGVIENGATIQVGILLNGGQNLGSQWMEGEPQDAGNTLTTTNARISLGDDGKVTYGFTLHCDGRGGRWGLHGGGQT